MVIHIYNPGTGEIKAGGSLASGQPGLHNKTLSHHQEIFFRNKIL
jgi:hypothetical protein